MVYDGASMTSSFRVGDLVAGKYRLVRESARSGDLGGISSAAMVFDAEHAWTGKRFTLKVLGAQAGEALEMRFLREARAASALVHAHVVKVYDVDRDPSGALYMVQELLEGETLAELLRRERRLPLGAALDLLVPIMDALALAHDVGVVHRDVRPATIFLARRHDGPIVPKLIDFGVSKLVSTALGGSLEHMVTVNNGSIETVAYWSPERLTNERIDASVDVWALAVILYEMLAGEPPVRTASFTDMAVRIATKPAPRVRDRVPDLPAAVAAVIDGALALRISERTTETTELVRGLCSATGRELPESAEGLIDATAATPPLGPMGGPTPVHPSPVSPSVLRLPVRRPTRDGASGQRLRLGVVGDPDSTPGASTEERLERALVARAAVVRVPAYADLVDALVADRVDVAWLAPLAYARARKLGAVGMFAVARRGELDPRALLVGRSPRVKSLNDLSGARVAWVDPWSTSGYALQRAALAERRIDPKVFAAEAFLGSHEAVGTALATGRADVGGLVGSYDRANNEVLGPWPPDAPLVVLTMSERMPPEVIAISPALAPDVIAFRRAFAAAGAPALAGLVGAEIEAELEDVDDARYAALLESSP